MPGCILRLMGEAFDVEEALKGCSLIPCSVWHRGEKRWRKSTRLNENSGANFVVSEASGDEVPVQVRDATEFVRTHELELRSLILKHGVEDAHLDFGWDFPFQRTPGQWNFFPAELLKHCAATGLSICVSVYAVGEEHGFDEVAARLAQQDAEDAH